MEYGCIFLSSFLSTIPVQFNFNLVLKAGFSHLKFMSCGAYGDDGDKLMPGKDDDLIIIIIMPDEDEGSPCVVVSIFVGIFERASAMN